MKKKYEVLNYDPNTFEPKPLITDVNEDLVHKVEELLSTIENVIITPLQFDPDTKGIVWGVIESDGDDKVLTHYIRIEPRSHTLKKDSILK